MTTKEAKEILLDNSEKPLSRVEMIEWAERKGEALSVALKALEDIPKYRKKAKRWKRKALQKEHLTDKEQRIFLAAMGREEKVCREGFVDGDAEYLVRVCREIERKVKKTLWK